MIGIARQLAEAGVLGINRRNADFTLAYNPRSRYPLVDDKLRTKRLALEAGLAVPELYGVVERQGELRALGARLMAHGDFVLKPAHGSGGAGILVVAGHSRGVFRTIEGAVLDEESVEHHVSDILGGIYSLGGMPDRAMIEYRVKYDPIFDEVCFQGVPDIRIVVFLGVPVMAMVRLPTRHSRGKANLHQGAIGAGIDISTGRTLHAVLDNRLIMEHPDTGQPVNGLEIPEWDRLLRTAAECFELTGLGYQGVDIVLDRDKGPLLLELNARPGLNIQIANDEGLLKRLATVEAGAGSLGAIDDRVAFARDCFAHRKKRSSNALPAAGL